MKHLTASVWVGLTFGALASGCGGDDAPGDTRNPHYVAAENALKTGCFASNANCHGGTGGLAGLNLGAAIAAGDVRTALVNVPACEYSVMDLVEPGDPANSWLIVKVTGDIVSMEEATPPTAFYGDLVFTPSSSWNESMKCNQTIRGFGQRMPQVAPFEIQAAHLAALETWIEMGAPGPNDPVGDAGM